jgi:hypothetical protein
MHGMPPKKSRKTPAKGSAKMPVEAPEPLNVYAQHADYKKRHGRYPTSYPRDRLISGTK